MKLTPKMQELTAQVLKDMEGGKMPWDLPWFGQGMFNWASRHAYRGMNIFSLSYGLQRSGLKTAQFMTFNQAQKAGGTVKRGSHGFPVCFFSMIDDKKTGKKFPLMKTAIVFSVDQVDGVEPRETKNRELTPNALGDKIISLCGIRIQENGASSATPAFYRPGEDVVEVPARNLWKTDEAYYSTVFHELIHATQTEDRVKRDVNYVGTGRAFEELVAELGGAFLSSYVGFAYSNQHSAYIKSWCQALRDKEDALYKAASLAQKAVDYLLRQAGELKPDKSDAVEPETATA
jgi:antirestriction protein ArdC